VKKIFIGFTLIIQFYGVAGSCWGKRGHEIIASTAARILEEKKGKKFLKQHEFDLGYYANVPDLIWRKTASEIEPPQHYLDWTKDFESIFKTPMGLPLEFRDFKTQMGAKFDIHLGVVPYRIHGLSARCKSLAKSLLQKNPTNKVSEAQKKASQGLQGPLLVCLGTLGHYTGDLSMPLHLSENHDGQLTGQKGVHVYFEAALVDELDPDLKVEVMAQSLASFEKTDLKKMNGDQAVRAMINDSLNKVPDLLKLDKSTNRHDLTLAKNKFKSLIVERLVQGSILTAVVWSEILEGVNEFDENHFYFFDGSPDYIFPGKEL